MRNIRHLLDLKHKKPLRLGLLLLSTLLIIIASALVYASVIYETALNVGDTSAVTTGSGSTSPAEVSFTPASIMMLVVAALIVGLSIFGFLRQASRRVGTPRGRGLLPPMQGEDWGNLRKKEEGEE